MTLYNSVLSFPSRPGTGVQFYENGKLHSLSWSEYFEQIVKVASALQHLGVKKNSRVAIMANTSLQWGLVDLATQSLGAVTIPLYHNSTSDEIQHILQDSETKYIFMERVTDTLNLKKESLTGKTLVCFHDGNESVMSWSDFLRKAKFEPGWFESLTAPDINDLATIVYTSGTTGLPKGVCLTHVQIISEVQEAFSWGISSNDKTLCFLPLAHVFGRVEFWAHVYWGYELAFAEGIDRLRQNLAECKPTVFFAVPRVFEKFYDVIAAQMETVGLKRRIFEKALSVAEKVSEYTLHKRKVPLTLALEFELAQTLVFQKIQKAFGGRLRFAVSGGAPLNPAISKFFYNCGILILEGYGLTETTAAIAVNRTSQFVFGTVGLPLGDVQVKIADDGEILLKSKKIMVGYNNLPEETAKVLQNGWFATGDIGEILPTGELKITDRKKDLIKTSGGKYVAPQKLENLTKDSSLVGNSLIYGDQKKFVVALISLSPETVSEVQNGLSQNDLDERIRNHIANVNSQLASFETIKKFVLTQDQWTVENGSLTPSLKLKRKKLSEKYKDLLEALYD